MGKPYSKYSNQNGFSLIMVLLIVIIVGIVGFTGWYVWNAQKNNDKTLDNIGGITPTKTVDTNGWTIFSSSQFHYSFRYPPNGYSMSGSSEQLDPDINTASISLLEDKYKEKTDYPGILNIIIYQKESNVGLLEWLTQSGALSLNYVSGAKKATIGNKPGYIFNGGGYVGHTGYAVELDKNQVIVISVVQLTDLSKSVINTFKFH